ncbi:MAG TPA: DUF4438 domain-containing protein [Streptosporangiaceae bacterium]|nr:DUF4438 domain-containing protein [Streptosporangiaceae bacterium]
MSAQLAPVAVNLLGVVEHPSFGDSPYRIDADGAPYVPVGDGGLVLGVRLGDFALAPGSDHVAPGACLVHPDDAARHALLLYSCIGNQAVVRSGAAAGATGAVIGKRGESGRLIAGFDSEVLPMMRPGDQVSVRSAGQGAAHPVPAGVMALNVDPGLLQALPITRDSRGLQVSVRAILPAKLAGNGLGRPAAAWDLDLQVPPARTSSQAAPVDLPLLLGDLVAINDIDARYNIGYRHGWVTIGVIVHGASPLPGHGPGMTAVLTGPASALRPVPDVARHTGLTASMLNIR